jgi:4-hydroxy-tetrahydrodipicolinate reductase
MKIALIGFGKMGQEIAQLAIAAGHEIVLKINSENAAELTVDNLQKAEVAIEFSNPSLVQEHIQICLAAGVPIVVGTTAWYSNFDHIAKQIQAQNGALFYATNFSIGVNLFWKITQTAAKLISNYDYQVHIDEIHHTQKLDAPSGTAITTAELILEEMRNLTSWTNEIVTKDQLNTRNNSSNSELLIRSVREEQVPGTHTVCFENEIDQISVSHIAHNRKGFAAGAIQAAKFIVNKKGIFNMNDLLSL